MTLKLFFSVTIFLIISADSLNILVYAPAFAASHSNFLGKLADTLTERGHNVTFLIPIVDIGKRDECISVKLTKDVIIVEAGDEMLKRKGAGTHNKEIMEAYWRAEIDSSNLRNMFQWFNSDMKVACHNFLRRRDIFNEMKAKHFDVAILEPISVCGLAFVSALEIEKVILASSCSFFDSVLPHIGEPLDFSYIPSSLSATGEVMTLAERYENWLVTKELIIALEDLYDREMALYREYLGEHIADWRELLPKATLFFVNSNPFLDFPRLVLQKTVPIGGISINFEWIKQQKLSDEWDEVMGRRQHSILISFGSMIKSMHMPKIWRNTLLEVIKSMPNVTFIWKYESDEISFAYNVSNLHFSKWVPQTALLTDHRLSAFLTHGGLGSTMELAYSGKPAVVIPVFGDQMRNANMLARHGSVILLRKNSLDDVGNTRQAFHDILLDARYRRNATKLADILNHQPYSPKETVIKYVEFVGKHGPFPHMDPYGRHLNYFQKTFLDIYALFVLFYAVSAIIFVFFCKFAYSKIRIYYSAKNTKKFE